jgi:hypothetical protein
MPAQKREPSAQVGKMHEAGYVSAAEAAEAIGVENVGTIHRMLRGERLTGKRVGYYWYVEGQGLYDAYANTPIAKSVEELLKRHKIRYKNGARNGRG